MPVARMRDERALVGAPVPVADRCVISAILNDMRDLALSLDVSDQLRLRPWFSGAWAGH